MYYKIKEEAKKKGLNISQLERKAGLSRGSINKWRKSSPTLDTLEKVAEAMGLKVTTLIDRLTSEKE